MYPLTFFTYDNRVEVTAALPEMGLVRGQNRTFKVLEIFRNRGDSPVMPSSELIRGSQWGYTLKERMEIPVVQYLEP